MKRYRQSHLVVTLGVAFALWAGGCNRQQEPAGEDGMMMDFGAEPMDSLPPEPDQRPTDGPPDGGLVEGTICSQGGWCWDNPLPQGNSLHALWSYSETDVWLAGSRGTLLHYDGTTFRKVQSKTVQPLSALFAVGTDLYAVGGKGTVLKINPKTRDVVPIASGATKDLYAIFALGPTNLYVGGERTLMRFDGTTWTDLSATANPGFIRSISGTSDKDVWAVGDGFGGQILHYDGTKWKTVDSAASGNQGLSSVLAVGGEVYITSRVGTGSLFKYDGTLFRRVPLPSEPPLYALFGSAKNDIFAAGEDAIFHYDGTTWEKTAAPKGLYYGIRGASPSRIYAVGHGGAVLAGDRDGKNWTLKAGDLGARGIFLSAVFALAPDQIWAVGPGRFATYDGKSWVVKEFQPPTEWYSLFGTSKTDLYAVGYDGGRSRIEHYDGKTWTNRKVIDGVWLRSVWGSSSKDIWTVGNGGHIYHFDGTAWNLAPGGMGQSLDAVHGTSATDIWAVGSGTVLHYDGTWKRVAAPVGTDWLTTVYARGKDDVWAGGSDSKIWQYDGTQWKSHASGGWQWVQSIYATKQGGKDDVWAVLSSASGWGQIQHYTGSSFVETESGCAGYLSGIARVPAPATDLLVVGGAGAILRRR